MDFSLLLCTALPWWNVIAQNEQLPKQPLELTILNLTSSIAGIPPSFSYIGWYSFVYGSA